MIEKIIFAPEVQGTDLLKNLAWHGQSYFNLRICGSAELARMALMRSGVPVTEEFLDVIEETALIAKAADGVDYFGKTTYADIRAIASAIKTMRCLITDDSEEQSMNEILSKGLFAEKNRALFCVYQNYLKTMAEEKLLDSVGIIRKAIRESKPIAAEFLTLKEFPLNPLETVLLNKLSGGNFTCISLRQVYRAAETKSRIASIKNCYGAPNEVETVLDDIYSGKNLDRCTIAVTDSKVYGQLFFDYALLYGIPVTFGCGIPIINSNPARLLMLYYRWLTGGFFGIDALKEMLTSDSFSQSALMERFPEESEGFNWGVFYDILGGLRFTNIREINRKRMAEFRKAVEEESALFENDEENKEYQTFLKKKQCLPYLEIMADELSLQAEEFISRYAFIRKGDSTETERLLMALDQSAASAIYGELSVLHHSGMKQTVEDVIPNLLQKNVCVQKTAEGRVHVTSIDGAMTSVRSQLYIVGLTAAKYPGSPKENYLLLDTDIRMFGEGAEYCTANKRVQQKIDRLMSLVRLASALGSDVNISYAGMNVSELKRENASSLVYELFREQHGDSATADELEAATTKIEYFEPAISPTRLIGRAYNSGQKIVSSKRTGTAEELTVPWNLEKEYSPSALSIFFDCPRRFMLHYLLKLPEPEDTDPFEVMAANEMGTVAHSLMECLANSEIGRDEFLKLSEIYFDRFLANKPPLIAEKARAVKEQFLEMMETAYETDPHRETLMKEEDIHCVHETGVKIMGYPDRVEKLEDDSCLIVDFKSGNTVVHVEDDIDTCLQVVIYAYLMEQQGYKVSGGEFRYIRRGETVKCRYDEEMKARLTEKLSAFRDAMISGVFPIADTLESGKDPCRYCKYGSICGKGAEEGAED